jgi:hypothetical protein
MKKILAAFAAGLVALALGACAVSQLQTAAQKLQSDVTIACNIFTPAIAPWAPFFATNPAITAFNTDAAAVCAGNAVLNLTSLDNIVNSSGEAAQAAIKLIPNLTAQQVALAQSVVGALEGSLKNAIAAYRASVPAAVSTAASAPVAASQ